MHFLSIFFTLFFFSFSLQAAEESLPTSTLSDKEQKQVVEIESYLNNLRSIEAGFLQISDAGEMRHGKIALERPGKMRVDYDPPSKDFIVADGSFIHLWDEEMNNQSSIPLDASLASFILRDPIKLSGDIKVTSITHASEKIEITLITTEKPEEGELTLIFEDKPLKLRQWRVLDPQGRLTGVSLESAHEDVVFPSSTFKFISPKKDKDFP